MEFITAIKDRIPDYAKDIRLNLDAVLARSSLEPHHAAGAALAAAFAARSKPLVDAIRGGAGVDAPHLQAALTASSLMGMNNVWYPFVEMAADDDLKTMRAELRMERVMDERRRTVPASSSMRWRPASSASASSACSRTTALARADSPQQLPRRGTHRRGGACGAGR
jgi:hypothetical protein